jgi:prophage antirepressor-like protein
LGKIQLLTIILGAKELGNSNLRDAIARHCRGVAKHDLLTKGGSQEVSIIPERDVYRLVMQSNLPEVEQFVAWVVADIHGYPETNRMTTRLDEDEVNTCTDISSGQVRDLATIDEAGL